MPGDESIRLPGSHAFSGESAKGGAEHKDRNERPGRHRQSDADDAHPEVHQEEDDQSREDVLIVRTPVVEDGLEEEEGEGMGW